MQHALDANAAFFCTQEQILTDEIKEISQKVFWTIAFNISQIDCRDILLLTGFDWLHCRVI
jgi:hypothetical protein